MPRPAKSNLLARLEPRGLRTNLAAELKQVVLIGLSPSIAAYIMEPVRGVAANAALTEIRPADLSRQRQASENGSPQAFPERTLLILQDRQADESGLKILRQLRAEGDSTPAILIVTGDDFQCPSDLDQLGDFDLIPLSELSRFALRRSLLLLGAEAARERILNEVAGRLGAYERMLASKDEERLRVLEVATALERRLGAAEAEFQQNEGSWAGRLARSDTYIAQLEQRIAELEGNASRPVAVAAEESRQRRQMALELAFHRDERVNQDATIAELRKTCQEQEQKLRRTAAEQAQLGDLASRLGASEKVRGAQTQEILDCQQRIGELEQNLETIAALLEAEQETASADSGVLLEELTAHLTQVDGVRSQQQGTIDQLSRNLAVQQVDDTFDNAQSRRNVVRRVDEAVQCSKRFGTPLLCLMIGIDNQNALRREHGSVSFDFMLVQIAQRLQLTLRSGDIVMRYGDGEFLLISDAKNRKAARSHAARLVRTVSAEPLELGARQVEVSLSIAVLRYRDDMGGASDFIRHARRGLLQAQTQGERQILVVPASAGVSPPPGAAAGVSPPPRAEAGGSHLTAD